MNSLDFPSDIVIEDNAVLTRSRQLATIGIGMIPKRDMNEPGRRALLQGAAEKEEGPAGKTAGTGVMGVGDLALSLTSCSTVQLFLLSGMPVRQP